MSPRSPYLVGPVIGYLVSAALCVTGCVSPYWQMDRTDHWGLWVLCARNCYSLIRDSVITVTGFHRATQVLICLSLFAGSLAGVCLLVYLILLVLARRKQEGDKAAGHIIRTIRCAGYFSLCAGVLGLAGLMVFGSEQLQLYTAPKGYGFWLSVVGSAGFSFVGVVIQWIVSKP